MNKLPPAVCPRCESEQGFVPKTRPTEHRWMEVFIRCTMCGWEDVLRISTPETELVLQRIQSSVERMEYETARHGQPSNSTVQTAKRLRRKHALMMAELYREARGLDG